MTINTIISEIDSDIQRAYSYMFLKNFDKYKNNDNNNFTNRIMEYILTVTIFTF